MTITAGPVLVHDDAAVRTITLNRPEKRNAIDIEVRIALAEALESADRDPGIRVIIVTGAGLVFCSGGDISTMQRMPAERALERVHMAQRRHQGAAGHRVRADQRSAELAAVVALREKRSGHAAPVQWPEQWRWRHVRVERR